MLHMQRNPLLSGSLGTAEGAKPRVCSTAGPQGITGQNSAMLAHDPCPRHGELCSSY